MSERTTLYLPAALNIYNVTEFGEHAGETAKRAAAAGFKLFNFSGLVMAIYHLSNGEIGWVDTGLKLSDFKVTI